MVLIKAIFNLLKSKLKNNIFYFHHVDTNIPKPYFNKKSLLEISKNIT